MARTNRPLPEMGKSCGLIVDLFGVFADLRKALNFDEAELEEVAVDWEKLKATVPGAVANTTGVSPVASTLIRARSLGRW